MKPRPPGLHTRVSKPKIVTIGHARIVIAPGHSAKVVVALNFLAVEHYANGMLGQSRPRP